MTQSETHVKRSALDGRPRAGKVYEVPRLHSGHAHLRDYIVTWHFQNAAPFKIKVTDSDYQMTVDPRKTSLRDIRRVAVRDRWGNIDHYMFHFRFIPDGWNMKQEGLPL